MNPKTIEQKAIDKIRILAIDTLQKANSCRIEMPMGATPMVVLWTEVMNYNPKNTE